MGKKGVRLPLILTLLLISLYNNLIHEMNVLPKLNLLNTLIIKPVKLYQKPSLGQF